MSLATQELERRAYFQEWYGYICEDQGHVDGKAASDLPTHIESALGYRHGWPLPDDPLSHITTDFYDPDTETRYSLPPDQIEVEVQAAEDQLFDVIEFIHDHVSQGIEEPGAFHQHNGCGWHYKHFDPAPAQDLFRSRVNSVLPSYRDGFRLSRDGHVQHTAPPALQDLIDTPLLTTDEEIGRRVSSAISLYRKRDRTSDEQRVAVRELFDVLEKLRPLIRSQMIKGDEADLFSIANNFSLRHLNEDQKSKYDGPLWFSWLFYVNLATVHLLTRIRERGPVPPEGSTRQP